MNRRTFRSLVCLLLVASLLGGTASFGETDTGLFSKLKAKISAKVEQAKTKDFWVKQGSVKSASFAAGKVSGLLGSALGGVIGLAVGGPVGGAIGGLIGYRVAAEVTKSFVRPVVAGLVEQRLAQKKMNVKEVWKSLNKKAVTVEGLASAVGDIIGGLIGVGIGLALFGGLGPIAIPIAGAVTGVWLGNELGERLGRMLGRKLAKTTSHALIPIDQKVASATVVPPVVSQTTPKDPAGETQNPHEKYSKAYRDYVNAMSDSRADRATRERLLQEYRAAYQQLQDSSTSK